MTYKILQGDCRDVLKTLPDGSVHCCVTSPPYYGLRDYGTGAWAGGDPSCSHRPDDTPEERGVESSTLGGGKKSTGHKQEGYKNLCPRCGAERIDNQIGLEQTPTAYIEEMVSVFREVRRVLRDDGTVWLNLGDSYSPGGRKTQVAPTLRTNTQDAASGKQEYLANFAVCPKGDDYSKPKDLLGIPWRVALALQADGWYLRQDIIWHKPNPMPESVRDRCTKAHEYIFLLSKSEKYYFDSESMQEPVQSDKGNARSFRGGGSYTGGNSFNNSAVKERETSGNVPSESGLRNRRSVWTVPTQPFRGAHFAVFPPALIEPCILAGCPKGGTVLDPFGGAGTTALVADRHNRNSILIELNPEYAKMALERVHDDAPLFQGGADT